MAIISTLAVLCASPVRSMDGWNGSLMLRVFKATSCAYFSSDRVSSCSSTCNWVAAMIGWICAATFLRLRLEWVASVSQRGCPLDFVF